ncbi:MAG: DUF4105 domain-containing protein [Treponema sp.]|jgi:hypothetical protein|nr:DUF4105 domain-containing protein [Treponema sp.]
MGKMLRRAAVFALLWLTAIYVPLAAQAESGRGDDLTIKIAVMGPGSELYFWWGHIALVIEDARAGQSRFYDYGLFSFENDNFFMNFAFGRLWYSSGVSSSERNIAAYIHTGRDVVMYTLDLPPDKREKVWQYAERSVLPENRNYLYHHFRHNCTNPILEAIDLATDGQFKKQYADEPGRFTLRQHVRRHTWFSPFFDWILNFWMGQNIDVPITVWDEMFLPAEIGKCISEFYYADSSGASHPLVTDVEVIHRVGGRPAILDVPRRQWPRELAFSLCVALFLGFLFYVQAKSTACGQVALGVVHSLLGLLFGGAGLVLFFLSFFTNHDYTYHNANLLFANPLLLIAVPLGIRYAVSKNYDSRIRAEFILRLLWLLSALGVFISMLIKLLPWFWQQNLTDQMLMLPIALTLSLEPVGLKRMMERMFWRWL